MKRLLRENLAAIDGRVWLVTVTAPGSEHLPCSATTCGTKGEHPQRAENGCRVDEHRAVMWNRTAAKRWSAVHAAACTRLRRSGHRPPIVAYVWQLQTRGVLHLHLVLDYSPLELAAAKAYVTALRSLARRHGFGQIDARDRGDGSTVMESGRAAAYLSRYAADSTQLTEAIALKHRPRRLVWVARRLTASTAVTMRRLRRVRYLWVIRNVPHGAIGALARHGLPAWFRDRSELSLVLSLASAANAP